jgi:hypothetical protein
MRLRASFRKATKRNAAAQTIPDLGKNLADCEYAGDNPPMLAVIALRIYCNWKIFQRRHAIL